MAKVLVLEDDRLSQKVVEKMLAKAGHETLSANSTQQAWTKLQEHVLVDMVVLDNQLEQEWGWQLLHMLRGSPVYHGLPVIVYTGHTERSTIIRYVELGVQSLHVKPYKSEVILEELTKALACKWTMQVMEPAEVLYQRLKLTSQEYGDMLATASRTIGESLQLARQRLTSASNTQLFSALASIERQCRSVGITVIDGVILKIKQSIERSDFIEAIDGLRSIDIFLGLIRHRMLEVLQMSDSVARSALSITDPVGEKADAPLAPAASFAAAYARDIINKPLWHYGPLLRRVMRQPLLTPDELQAAVHQMGTSALFTAIAESQKMLQGVLTASIDEVVATVQATRGFLPVYKLILERITGTQQKMDSTAALRKILDQQGVVKVLLLAANARVALAFPPASLLNLRQLKAHTLGTSLISYEIGRLLRLDNDLMLAAAALVHDSGRWLFSVGEPGVYALALALAEDEKISLEEAETALFGLDHQHAGRQLLIATGQSELMQAAVALHHDPATVTDQDHIVTVTVIHLAHLLAQAALAGSDVEATNILTRLRAPDYVAWGLLKSRGVNLPLAPPELVDTLAAIANTSNWIAHQLIDSAG